MPIQNKTTEHQRIEERNNERVAWESWGPYLSERQWGTVREDYSPQGEAWSYFPHEHARSRAYRWGEDGIAGFSDSQQWFCLGLALWNGRDPILKERLFGLTNKEGNHGEDVKELYYYLDAIPSHAYLKMLYKYPQQAYPYRELVDQNQKRDRKQPEFELLDTGVFDSDHYFDVFIEYAKAEADDILMRITAYNRADVVAPLHILPQLWFRNTWSWGYDDTRPNLSATDTPHLIQIEHHQLGSYYCYCDGAPTLLFTDNNTNLAKLYGQDTQGYVKDAFHEAIINGQHQAVNPAHKGTKACAHYFFTVPAHDKLSVYLRLSRQPNGQPFEDFEHIFTTRIAEADVFYNTLQTDIISDEAKMIQRQAFAGMIWNKQFYYYDIPQWLNGDPGQPKPPAERLEGRNKNWSHLNNADILSMPDTWEYPWYASWDLAFHCVTFAKIDPAFAKKQILTLTHDWYIHPNGQFPAYEWSFDDANPPVHAWATWEIYKTDCKLNNGKGDTDFLERVLHKLMINFTWWVNRKDSNNNNVFDGGFLGLDNIGVFNRSEPLPNGEYLKQADATSWMAMYCLNLMRIALELSLHNNVYEDVATKFFEHFLYIAKAMTQMGDKKTSLWNDEDGFFYDVLHFPDGQLMPLKIRSMVGLIPLFAVEVLEPELLDKVPTFKKRLEWFLNYRPDLAGLVAYWNVPGHGDRRLLSLLRGHRMKMLLRRMLDESEFLSDHGIRSLSQAHRDTIYQFDCSGHPLTVSYIPGESESGLFGGNSNWRGPIWFPVNYLIITSLKRFAAYYGDDFKIECPTGSGCYLSLQAIAEELTLRLTRLFLQDKTGLRPIFGSDDKLQTDPHFKHYLLFNEYFDGDNGRGLGASHQTGWTGLIALLLSSNDFNKNQDDK